MRFINLKIKKKTFDVACRLQTLYLIQNIQKLTSSVGKPLSYENPTKNKASHHAHFCLSHTSTKQTRSICKTSITDIGELKKNTKTEEMAPTIHLHFSKTINNNKTILASQPNVNHAPTINVKHCRRFAKNSSNLH